MKRTSLQPRESRIKRYSTFLTFMAGMAMLGFLAQVQWIGLLIIAIFIVVAIVRHVSSRITYLLAYAALTLVPVGVLIANWVAAQNFAAYAFLLFVGGVIQTTVELKRQYAA
jgi:hypothetical protein